MSTVDLVGQVVLKDRSVMVALHGNSMELSGETEAEGPRPVEAWVVGRTWMTELLPYSQIRLLSIPNHTSTMLTTFPKLQKTSCLQEGL